MMDKVKHAKAFNTKEYQLGYHEGWENAVRHVKHTLFKHMSQVSDILADVNEDVPAEYDKED